MEFSQEGGEGATPYEVLLHAAMTGNSTRFTRQDGVEETWRIMQPLLDNPPPVHPYAPKSWGPEAADKLVGGHGRWHEPWIASAPSRSPLIREALETERGRLRRHHRRHRRGRRHARPPPGALREADPAARAGRLAAPRAAELARAGRVRRQPLRLPRHVVRRGGQAVPAADPLLRRRRDEALRRGALPAPQGGLRRASPPRRHLARVADLVRRAGAVLHPG